MSNIVEVDVHRKDPFGLTALHMAARKGNESKVEELLSLGAEVDAQDRLQKTPLLYAAIKNTEESHFRVAEILLKNGANPNAQDDESQTPLWYVVRKGNLKMVQLLLSYKACINVEHCLKYNLLNQAVKNNKNLDVLQLLLDFGLDVNQQSLDGKTPLHKSAIKNAKESHFGVAEKLLTAGADVTLRDNDGLTPFWYLLYNGTAKIVQLFLSFGADVAELHESGRNLLYPAVSINRDASVTRLLVDLGLDVNNCSENGTTSLHAAASYSKDDSHFEVAEILLKAGAKVNARDSYGKTPILYLVNVYSVKFAQLLLNYGADIDELGKKYRCLILHAAIRNVNSEIVRHLVNLGVDVNCRFKNGTTPVLEAVSHGSVQILKCLLGAGADASAADDTGNMPLDILVRKCADDEVEVVTKKLNLIAKHSDFSAIRIESQNFLTVLYKPQHEYLNKQIVKHVAKLRTLDVPVHPALMKTVSTLHRHSEYYETCLEELTRAKSTKLHNSWVSFFNLLVDGRRKLKNYAGNKNLIKDFLSSDCEVKFPIYGPCMRKNVENGVKVRELFDESCKLLSECLPIFDSFHLIVRDTIECGLNRKNLLRFCE